MQYYYETIGASVAAVERLIQTLAPLVTRSA